MQSITEWWANSAPINEGKSSRGADSALHLCYVNQQRGESMDDLKETLDKLREELTNAGKRLADLAERGQKELPHAAKRINEEYERLQGLLDAAVDKLRRR